VVVSLEKLIAFLECGNPPILCAESLTVRYAIKVDLRHLTLIADYMTFGGGYRPFNRIGLDSNVSPFLKMSFEQTCVFLTKATLEGDIDRLETPSARLVMGKNVVGGTGQFDILAQV
jgi:DNA-directed RNA polymerase I subunit RPA1